MQCHVLCSAFRVDGFDAFCRRACTSGFGFRTDGIADIPHALDSPKRVKALKYHLVSAKDVETPNSSLVRLFYKPPRDAGCGALRGFATRPWACMPQMQYCDRGSAPHGVFARRMRRQTRTTVFPALLTFPTAGCSAAFGGGGAGRPFEVESWRSRAGLRHAARVAPDRPGDQRVVPLRWLQHLLDGAGRERRRRCAPDALQDHRFVGHP